MKGSSLIGDRMMRRGAAAVSLRSEFAKAQRHLARRDAVLKRVIRVVGPCTLQYRPDRFSSIVRSIISQQISTKAAAAIALRLETALAETGICPAAILAAGPDALRAAGLSRGKIRSLQDLAEKVHQGEVCLERLHRLPDEEVIEALDPVHGIGRWTAEMFLIFSLGRLDVLPVDDWGFRVSVQRQYELAEPPAKGLLVEMAEPWRPYRSIATWYFWRSLGFVPQS
jgi:DNA-3-methyladenine glycosylase II